MADAFGSLLPLNQKLGFEDSEEDYDGWTIEVKALLILSGVPLVSDKRNQYSKEDKRKQRSLIVSCLDREWTSYLCYHTDEYTGSLYKIWSTCDNLALWNHIKQKVNDGR